MLEELLPKNPELPFEYTDEYGTTYRFSGNKNYVNIDRTCSNGMQYLDSSSYDYFVYLVDCWNRDVINRNASILVQSITKQDAIDAFRCHYCRKRNDLVSFEEQDHYDNCPYALAMRLKQQIKELTNAD